MNWDSMKIFLAIAKVGSLSGAAQQMGVNHSTIFRRLKSLEDEIGGRVFDKIDNRYHLTSVGEELLEHAQLIADRFDMIERKVMGKDFSPKGLVRITAPFNIANRYLPDMLGGFCRQYPEIDVEILASNQQVNMNSRLADVALRVTASPPEFLVGRKVAQIAWGVFASQDYVATHPKINSVNDLAGHNLIGGTGSLRQLTAFRWLDQHYDADIRFRCDELTAMSYFAETGQGVAFLPLDQVRDSLKPILPFMPAGTSDLWVLTHPDLRKTERIKLLLQHLYDQFSDQNFQANSEFDH